MPIDCSPARRSQPGGGRAVRVSLPWAPSCPGLQHSAGKRVSDPLWRVPCGDSFILLQCRTG